MSNFWQKFKKPIIALAPMAGITDSAFRQMCKKYGADVVYTEMISADALYYKSTPPHPNNKKFIQLINRESNQNCLYKSLRTHNFGCGGKKTLELLKFKKTEKPIIAQLFGKRPEMFPTAAALIESAGFDGIDINFGCPAPKVISHGGGVSLLYDLPLCRKIIENTIKATKLPVSIKTRVSIKNKKTDEIITCLDFVKNINDLPIAAIMIHGRSYEQGFSGPIDYEMIKRTKQIYKGIVLANGGITTPESVGEILEKTGTDGIGLARSIQGKPWLFKQIKDYLKTGKYKNPSWPEIKKTIFEHAKLSFREKGKHGLIELRKHLAWYVRGLPNASELRNQLVRINTIEEIRNILT